MRKSKKIVPVVERPAPIKVRPVVTAPLAAFGSVSQFVLQRGDKRDAPSVRGYTCVAAWDVQHTDSEWEKFMAVCERVGNRRTLYHGTRSVNIRDIARQGLRPGNARCMFGSGIYMGGINKAILYANESRAKYVIKVEAALGQSLMATEAQKHNLGALQKEGFHSVWGRAGYTRSWGGTLALDEFIVYSPDQVMALKVYEYQVSQVTFIAPPEGRCVVAVEQEVANPKGKSAFMDLLSKKACDKPAYTRLIVEDKTTIWVCAQCVEQQRLKIGSKLEIKVPPPSRIYTSKKRLGNTTQIVRVTGVVERR